MPETASDTVAIFEMGPRDGLQNIKKIIDKADKIQLIDLLSACGFPKIEATSFVSPKWVPQLADGAEVLAGIKRDPAIRYTAIVPNMIGYQNAKAAGADEVAVIAAASETFTQKNINCSIDESFERIKPIMEAAKNDGIPVRGYVSCIAVCPYEGDIPPQQVERVTKHLLALGCYQVSLGDTVGRAQPAQIETLCSLLMESINPLHLAGHFHDTSGLALDNISVALDHGLRCFDSAIAGLGGCPYAPGAKGNVDTQKTHQLLQKKGYNTGIDAQALDQAAQFIRTLGLA